MDARERALAPRIHLLRKTFLRRWMDGTATRACPSCASLSAASRVNPTCGVKPGHDADRPNCLPHRQEIFRLRSAANRRDGAMRFAYCAYATAHPSFVRTSALHTRWVPSPACGGGLGRG